MPFPTSVFVLARGSSGYKYQPTASRSLTYINWSIYLQSVIFLIKRFCCSWSRLCNSSSENVAKATQSSHFRFSCSHVCARTRTRTHTQTYKFICAWMYAHVCAANVVAKDRNPAMSRFTGLTRRWPGGLDSINP